MLGDRCLVDEGVLAGVLASNKDVLILDVKPFKGSKRSLISASAQVDKSSLLLLTMCRGLPALREDVDIRGLVAPDRLDNSVPQACYLLTYGFLPQLSLPFSTSRVNPLEVSL